MILADALFCRVIKARDIQTPFVIMKFCLSEENVNNQDIIFAPLMDPILEKLSTKRIKNKLTPKNQAKSEEVKT